MSGVPWHVGYLARETFENRLEAGYIDEHHKIIIPINMILGNKINLKKEKIITRRV